MSKPDLLEQWHKRKGSESWSIDDITELIVEASNIGEEIGERYERERIIALLKDDDTLHDIWWIVYRDLKPFPDSGRLSQWEIAEVLKALLIKVEN